MLRTAQGKTRRNATGPTRIQARKVLNGSTVAGDGTHTQREVVIANMGGLKSKRTLPPRLKRLARSARAAVMGASRAGFTSSADYWEDRYKAGGNSGIGTYGRLAAFKAEVINEFVTTNAIQTVIEFGSGDGAQLELANYPRYTGVDVSPTIIDLTRRNFANQSSIQFLHASEVTSDTMAELALSLDVIYHLVEDEVFVSYMRQLFKSATRFVIIYSSDEDRQGDAPHVRQRQFSSWIAAHQNDFRLSCTIANPYPYSQEDPETSWSDFHIFERIHSLRAADLQANP